MVKTFWEEQMISDELHGYVPAWKEEVKVTALGGPSNFRVQYRYEYAGKKYESHQLSPFAELNELAIKDNYFRVWLDWPDNDNIQVFVDPDDPSRSSLLSGVAREGRSYGPVLGVAIVAVGLGLLTLIVRPEPRLQDVFS